MLSAERISNYIIFLCMDTMLEAYDKGLNELHDQFLDMRQRPECIAYIFNWVNSHKNFLRQTESVIHNPELERAVCDGIRLAHAQYYTNGKLLDGTKNSDYAKECIKFYKEDIAERKEVE